MICTRCNAKISRQEEHKHAGRTLCEDCYIDAVSAPKTCDPWAVYTATRTDSKGESLTPKQQRILSLIKAQGPLALEQICNELSIDEQEFRTNFSTLRHMELAQACKKEGLVFYIPFQKTNP